jgi:uncharacterized protein YkwD
MRLALLKALGFVLLLGVAPLAVGGHPTPPAPAFPPPPPGAPPEVRELVEAVNRHRVARGLSPLIWDARLAAVARAHSAEMVRLGRLSHADRKGRTPFDRLDAAGVRWSAAAENIAEGHETAREVLGDWLASPGHRANLESRDFTHHGVALVGKYWTHVFVSTPAPRAERAE